MPTKIVIRNNGSIRVEGDFEMYDQNGKKFELGTRTAISLCRCGQSKDKPLCDGSHREWGFQSEVIARSLS